MTFQIGVVGSDGVLLVSDLSWSQIFERRITSQHHKTYCDQDLCIVACSSGSEWPDRIAKKCVGKSFANTAPKEIAENVYAHTNGIDSKLANGSVLLAAMAAQNPELWRIDFGNNGQADPFYRIYSKTITGDQENPAGAILERYIGNDTSRLSTEELKFLLAHIVITAGILNPAGISGLEMAICRRDEFGMVSDDDIRGLKGRSAELDAEISRRLFSTYL